jgi:hypothetical protein
MEIFFLPFSGIAVRRRDDATACGRRVRRVDTSHASLNYRDSHIETDGFPYSVLLTLIR